MKVSELIKHLETLDPELNVFVRGYEGGYDYPTISEVHTFKLNVNDEWWYGSHEINSLEGDVKGVILERPNKI
jgi:hypothetical protein